MTCHLCSIVFNHVTIGNTDLDWHSIPFDIPMTFLENSFPGLVCLSHSLRPRSEALTPEKCIRPQKPRSESHLILLGRSRKLSIEFENPHTTHAAVVSQELTQQVKRQLTI